MQNHRINDYSLWFGLISIIGIPISISMSQGLFVVAVILVLISRYHSKFNENTQPLPKSLRIVLIFGLSIYISWFLSAMIHSVIDRSIEPLVKAAHSDLKDVWLILMSVWVFHHGSFSESHRRRLLRVVGIVFLITLFLGLVSSVTPFRLSKLFYHLQHGWHFSSEARLQHPMLHLPFGITFYMPVGLLGTHLAFGAQLAFFAIPVTLYLVDHYLMKNRWSKFQLSVAILFALTLFVLLLNNARSAILGLLSALLAGILFLSCLKWRRSALKLILPPAIVLFLATAVAIVNPNAGDLLMQSIGIEKKHSDYQRIMLWSVTSEVALDNVAVGVGPGMFSESVYNQMNQDAIDKPYLWYLYMQTERGHAHNDFLFQVTTAGLVAGFLFIAFWISLLSMVFRTSENQFQTFVENETDSASKIDSFLVSFLPFVRYSPILLLFGGLFQCYFLDDQVILPFWLFVGLAALKSK